MPSCVVPSTPEGVSSCVVPSVVPSPSVVRSVVRSLVRMLCALVERRACAERRAERRAELCCGAFVAERRASCRVERCVVCTRCFYDGDLRQGRIRVRGEVRPNKTDLADAVMMERAMENREGHRRQLGLNLIELRLMKWDEG